MGKLNKLTSILLSAIMIIGIFGVVPFAAIAAVSGSYEYSVKSDSTAKITRYIDNGSKTVTIPSTIGGYVSTEIGQRAFENRSSFNAVTIPSSITSIGEFAFRGCTGLASVSIPNTVEKIGNCAFGYTYGSGHYVKIDGFTIYGTKGTAAERYAYSNGLNFVERAAAPAEVRLSRSNLALSVGEAYTLKSTVLPNDAKNKTCKWYTSRSSVAAVSSTGKVTAKAVGTAVITAKTVNGKKATCKVTVSPAPTGVKISPTALTLGKGESYTLKGTVLPNDAKDKTCKWYTSRSSVAAVSSTGKVTAKAVGTAVITAKTVNGKKATCKVTVKTMPTSVKTSPTALTLGKGESYTIKENTNSGSYANAANLKWTSTNTRVVTVKKGSGNQAALKAVGTGTSSVRVTLYNGRTATCKVTVKTMPTSVKTNPTALTLGKGESYTIKENTNSGSYANAANLKWTSTNTRVVTVKKGSGNQAALKAVGTGTASVRVTLYNGRTATCRVTIKKAPASVKISPSSLTLNVGESYTIKENTNSGSYANAANLKWTSTNTRVVTVKKGSGNQAALKAVGTGTASVRVTLYNGRTATCRVTIKKAPASVKISPSSLTLNVGESYTIKENTNSGSYANAANLKWTSTNTRVVTVKKGSGNKAVLKAVSEGTANVKLTLYNGKTAICKVSVVDCSDVYSAKTDKDYYSLSHKVYEIVNQERIKAGVKPLRFNDKVYKAAMIRAKECHKYFSHIRPNGKDCFTALSEAGVKQNYAGENIAVGFSSPKSVMEGWMQSSGHRSNILNPVFTDFGCGVCNTGEWTQFFCKVV